MIYFYSVAILITSALILVMNRKKIFSKSVPVKHKEESVDEMKSRRSEEKRLGLDPISKLNRKHLIVIMTMGIIGFIMALMNVEKEISFEVHFTGIISLLVNTGIILTINQRTKLKAPNNK